MPRPQFTIRALLAATLFAGVGFWFLGKAEKVTWWEFAFLVTSGFAAFGVAIGVIVGSTAKWAGYGAGVGLLFTLRAIIY